MRDNQSGLPIEPQVSLVSPNAPTSCCSIPTRRPQPPLSQLGQTMAGQAVRHCFLSICCHTRVSAHVHTQTCISQRHEHAHVHAVTYSPYLYLHKQPGERRRREGQNRSRSPIGLPPHPPQHQGPLTVEGLADPLGS